MILKNSVKDARLLVVKPYFLAAFGGAFAFLSLSGCGGGSGGSGPSPNPTTAPTTSPTAQPTAQPTTAPATTLFEDEFSGSSFDLSKWTAYGPENELQLTRFGLVPEQLSESGTSFARVRLETYNPDAEGFRFYGTEVLSQQRFARGQGVEAEARLRNTNVPPGAITAFFMLFDRYDGPPSPSTYRKDEIDFEFLGSEREDRIPTGQTSRLYLNIWNDWNQQAHGYDPSNEPSTTRTTDDVTYRFSTIPNFDWTQWHTYKIRWLPDRTEFYVDDQLQRVEREVKPDDAMSVRLNIWSGLFGASDSFTIAPSPAENKTVFFDVDYVRVRGLGDNTPNDTVSAQSFGSNTPISPQFRRAGQR